MALEFALMFLTLMAIVYILLAFPTWKWHPLKWSILMQYLFFIAGVLNVFISVFILAGIEKELEAKNRTKTQ